MTVVDGAGSDRAPLTFEVIGTPAPQGSKRHVGNGVMVESSKRVKPWRQAVATAARDVADHADVEAPLDGPLHLDVVFRFPMPASRSKAQRALGALFKVSAPDLSKLVRSTEDALQEAGLIRDDARICRLTASKHEIPDGWTGAVITLTTIPTT